MQLLYRAVRVFADEGLGGLFRRVGRKIAGQRPPEPVAASDDTRNQAIATATANYDAQVAAFRARTHELGHTNLEDYYWYHTFDLGNGLLTPGDYDFRDQLPAFDFPDDMTGMRVLDVGSATGFFAFEFARRGADVTSVELPSLTAWDMVSAERDEMVRRLMAQHKADSPEQAYERHLEGPFRYCQRQLGAKITRCYSSIYDLTLDRLGGKPFDLVYAGDILMHLFSPFRALDVLSNLTRRELVVTLEVPFPGTTELPLILFRGLANGDEGRTWWMTSPTCAEHMLRRLGFPTAAVVGSYSGIARRAWFPYERVCIRATR
jgi:SAM-dependent methyltransferase